MEKLLTRIDQKKKKLDSYKPLPQALTLNLDNWFKVALTYTSNALEGNTLSHAETALIVQDGITIGGKTLIEHQEAINQAEAITFTQKLAQTKYRSTLCLDDLLSIHRTILKKIDDAHAGSLRTIAVRIAGSHAPRPNYLKVPQLMDEFVTWLNSTAEHTAITAAEAHLKFVFIHPFTDGNGRTARLLFNFTLLQEGYPLTIIEKEKRMAYINAIEKALLHNEKQDYYTIMLEAIEHSLDSYLNAIEQSDMSSHPTSKKS